MIQYLSDISKNILKYSFQKLCNIKKIDSSLHCKKLVITNMTRIQLHIKAVNSFSPKSDYTVCGACYVVE